MKKVLLATLLLFSILLVGCHNDKVVEQEKLDTRAEMFNNINEDGSFVLTKNGVQKEFSDNKHIKKVHYYFDVLCGDCQRVHKEAGEFLEENIKNGNIEIMYHPTLYINTAKKPETEEFRNARRNELTYDIMYTVLNYPNDLDKIFEIMENSFELAGDKEAKEIRSEEEVHKTEKILSDLYSDEYYYFREKALNMLPKRDELVNSEKLKSLSWKEEKTMFVPFIYVEGQKSLDGENESVEEGVVKPLEGIINSIVPCETEETDC